MSAEDDAQLAEVLNESLLAANQELQAGKPEAALDMADIVLATLPAEGLEAVELAAMPIKIVALSYLGRLGEALQQLAVMESRAATHGGPDDREACRLLRERLTADLTPRANAAAELIKAGRPEGVVEMEAVANAALQTGQHMIAIGALVFLGKVNASKGRPEVARGHLLRAREHLETYHPLDEQRHATAIAQIEQVLATLP